MLRRSSSSISVGMDLFFTGFLIWSSQSFFFFCASEVFSSSLSEEGLLTGSVSLIFLAEAGGDWLKNSGGILVYSMLSMRLNLEWLAQSPITL